MKHTAQTLPSAQDLAIAGASNAIEFYDMVRTGKVAPLFGEGQCADKDNDDPLISGTSAHRGLHSSGGGVGEGWKKLKLKALGRNGRRWSSLTGLTDLPDNGGNGGGGEDGGSRPVSISSGAGGIKEEEEGDGGGDDAGDGDGDGDSDGDAVEVNGMVRFQQRDGWTLPERLATCLEVLVARCHETGHVVMTPWKRAKIATILDDAENVFSRFVIGRRKSLMVEAPAQSAAMLFMAADDGGGGSGNLGGDGGAEGNAEAVAKERRPSSGGRRTSKGGGRRSSKGGKKKKNR
jgi:hypothetical protein